MIIITNLSLREQPILLGQPGWISTGFLPARTCRRLSERFPVYFAPGWLLQNIITFEGEMSSRIGAGRKAGLKKGKWDHWFPAFAII
jgi:hypothetical protein